MNRFDRILGILLLLHNGRLLSAAEVGERFGVSPRTAYRDMETLSVLGVPVYAERGRGGGFRLLDGYVLPPLMFTTEEAVALLLSMTLFDSLRTRPFAAELKLAEQKLLAAVPPRLQTVLADMRQLVGFEQLPHDLFHREQVGDAHVPDNKGEQGVTERYLQAILDGRWLRLSYTPLYADRPKNYLVEPGGLFWDRDHWYLVGRLGQRPSEIRLFRADRVLALQPQLAQTDTATSLDVRNLLQRRWLRPAMDQWADESPVCLHLTPQQAQRLQQDWYYQHAHYEPIAATRVKLTFGQDDPSMVLELVRWLGPGAELVSPAPWRQLLQQELAQMLQTYA